MRRSFYWDSKQQKMIEGYPPVQVKFGQAPFVIGDTIDKYYHPGACQWTESRGRLKDFDKVCGTITTDKKLAPDSSWRREQQRKLREDQHNALHKAVAQVDAGTAPLSEETRHLCEVQNEIVSSALNFDAFNAVGRKTNEKGKRFRRK